MCRVLLFPYLVRQAMELLTGKNIKLRAEVDYVDLQSDV
jgi:hypothetical protein